MDGGCKEAEEISRANGCRFTSPGLLGFGFQPKATDIQRGGVKVSALSNIGTCVINDIFQAFVPDEMHVCKGIWEWALKVITHTSLNY
jgi:hypothetical protein